MRVITPMDLRRSLGSILDAASAGERFLIERDHRPLAMLVSVEDGRRVDGTEEDRRARVLAAIEEAAEFRARMARLYPPRPDDVDTVTAIREAREERSRQIERALDGPGHDESDPAGQPPRETRPRE